MFKMRCLCRSLQAGDEVFLKGAYIEVGMHYVGSFGTRCVCGPAYVPVIVAFGTTVSSARSYLRVASCLRSGNPEYGFNGGAYAPAQVTH